MNIMINDGLLLSRIGEVRFLYRRVSTSGPSSLEVLLGCSKNVSPDNYSAGQTARWEFRAFCRLYAKGLAQCHQKYWLICLSGLVIEVQRPSNTLYNGRPSIDGLKPKHQIRWDSMVWPVKKELGVWCCRKWGSLVALMIWSQGFLFKCLGKGFALIATLSTNVTIWRRYCLCCF